MRHSLAAVLCLGLGALSVGQDKEFKRYNGGSPKLQALEGKAAPALIGGNWFNTNSKKLELKLLKGKVVVLDFWAHW